MSTTVDASDAIKRRIKKLEAEKKSAPKPKPEPAFELADTPETVSGTY